MFCYDSYKKDVADPETFSTTLRIRNQSLMLGTYRGQTSFLNIFKMIENSNITGMFYIFIVYKDLLILWDCIPSLQNSREDRSLLATRSHLVIIIFISCMCFKVFIEKASDKLETCSSFREQWTYDLSVSAAVMVTLSTTTPLSSPQEKKDLSSWNSSWTCWMSPSLESSTSIKSRVCPDENGLWILI